MEPFTKILNDIESLAKAGQMQHAPCYEQATFTVNGMSVHYMRTLQGQVWEVREGSEVQMACAHSGDEHFLLTYAPGEWKQKVRRELNQSRVAELQRLGILDSIERLARSGDVRTAARGKNKIEHAHFRNDDIVVDYVAESERKTWVAMAHAKTLLLALTEDGQIKVDTYMSGALPKLLQQAYKA